MHPLTTDLAQQILALIKIQAYSLLGAIQDNKAVLGGSAGSGGGIGDPPAGFVGQLTQSNVTFDTAGSSRACSAGSAGSSSLVDNLDGIRLGIEICDDAIGDRHIDWGHGAGQVSAVDVPFQSSSGSIAATNVREAIEEAWVHGGVTGGSVVGSGVTGQVAYWTSADTIGGDAGFTYDAATDTITLAGGITVGALGAGLLESNAGGVISSDYTISGTVTMATGLDIDPFDASGQDLGDATHRWDLYTQDIIFGGASNANVITIPTARAIAFKIVDTAPVEYFRIDTAPQLEVIWNNGEVDVDFRAAALNIPNALFVQGSDGAVFVETSLTVVDGPVESTMNRSATGYFQVTTAAGGSMLPAFIARSEHADYGCYFLAKPDAGAQTGFVKAAFYLNARDEADAPLTTGNLFQLANDAAVKVTVTHDGDVGFGVTPLGKLHGFDTHGGFMYWEGDVDDGNDVVVIPNGAGDLERGAFISQVTYCNTAADWGSTHFAIGNPAATPTSTLYVDAVPNELQLQLKADGSVVLKRTVGTDTYDVCLWIVWQ